MFPRITKPHVSIWIHQGTGTPFAVRLDTRKLLSLCFLCFSLFFLFFLGTILFFREMERNRTLGSRVLELELKELVQSSTPATDATVSVPLVSETKSTEESSFSGSDPRVHPRLSELTVDCAASLCIVKALMVPGASGTAQGQMLIILEAELPRIGPRDPATQIRKRYFIYPGYTSQDELSPETIESFDKKKFRFSRALQATAQFQIQKLMRPLAVNVYLYDDGNHLINHERKTIEVLE